MILFRQIALNPIPQLSCLGHTMRHVRESNHSESVSMPHDYDPNDREAIEAALASTDPDNPIAKDFAQRLSALTAILVEATRRNQALPDTIEIATPRTILDALVIDAFRKVLAENPKAPPVTIVYRH
jgi:hypothetical protein